VYGHALEWKADEEAASAEELAKAEAIAKAKAETKTFAHSECLTAVATAQNEKDSQSQELEVSSNQ
jgi:hypothetical protein